MLCRCLTFAQVSAELSLTFALPRVALSHVALLSLPPLPDSPPLLAIAFHTPLSHLSHLPALFLPCFLSSLSLCPTPASPLPCLIRLCSLPLLPPAWPSGCLLPYTCCASIFYFCDGMGLAAHACGGRGEAEHEAEHDQGTCRCDASLVGQPPRTKLMLCLMIRGHDQGTCRCKGDASLVDQPPRTKLTSVAATRGVQVQGAKP